MTTALRKGARGPDTKTLQEALAKQGFSLSVDGHFGDATDLALRNYQRQNGLVADGIAGSRTLHSLGIKVSSVSRKKSKSENLHELLSRIGLTQAQMEAAQAAKPPSALSFPVSRLSTSLNGLRFIYTLESRRNVSNHLHLPPGASGVTIGPGYDMKERFADDVKADLQSIGVSALAASKASKGAGLMHALAKEFCDENQDLIDLSKEQEMLLLKKIIRKYELPVERSIKVDLTQYEYDALVSLVFNPGTKIFSVSHAINDGRIVDAMVDWKRRVISGGEILSGLENRRDSEVNLYLFGNYGRFRV